MELLNLEKFKSEVHKTLISKLDLEKLSRVNSSQARSAVAGMVHEIIKEQKVPLSLVEQEKIQADLAGRSLRLRARWSRCCKDPTISDILVNGKNQVFIEREESWKKADTSFRDDRHFCRSSTALSARSDGGWMSRRRWWMRGCRTVRA